jgi:hypothetical protein
MQTIRINSRGGDVFTLQELLKEWGYDIPATGYFGQMTDKAVRDFQTKGRLTADGIVGRRTWELLMDKDARLLATLRLKEEDFVKSAEALNVEVATVKAVQEVETGGRGGFFAPDRPSILFEGHIFWSQLKKKGVNPEDYLEGNEDILYPKWTKEHYCGGIKEYDRLEKAMMIDEEAAISSASWGLFQIMGFNHKVCGCEDVKEFVERMKENEGSQLALFTAFVQSNKLDDFLREKDWAGFAKRYNGPAYAENRYDEKLKNAYEKHKA